MLQQVMSWLERGTKLFERRGAPRVETPSDCLVVIDGMAFPLRNWSASGFLASPYDGHLREGRSFTVRIAIRHDHENFVIDARAVVVRRDAGGLAARFTAMSPSSRERVDDYFSHLALWLRVTR